MKKILIAYFSLSGNTERMAQYVAEGVRISGQQVSVKKLSELKTPADLDGYDGYMFASPTYHREMAGPMKTFLFMAKQANLAGKLAGAFGSYTHDGDAPADILGTMQYVFQMEPFELNSFRIMDKNLFTMEGARACQDYGRVFGEQLSKRA